MQTCVQYVRLVSLAGKNYTELIKTKIPTYKSNNVLVQNEETKAHKPMTKVVEVREKYRSGEIYHEH